MRRSIQFLTAAIVLLSIGCEAQTLGVAWGTPLNVGTGTSHNNIYPRITLTAGDVPLITWEDNSPAKVYASRKTGSVFSTPVALNPSGVSPFVANWAGVEVAALNDTVFAVFTSMPVLSGNAYAVRSVDGGLTWSDTVRIDQDSAKIPSFPTVTVLPGGNPAVAYMIADDGSMLNTEYVVARSLDGGNTYQPSVIPVNPGNVCECCPAALVRSETDLVLLYRNDISNLRDIWASFSTDGGASFPISSEIDTTNWFTSTCPSSGPSGLIVGDTLIYSWMSDATADARIYLGTMSISTQMIGLQRQIYPVGTSTQNYPVLAGNGDTLGLVWQGYNGSWQEVLFTWSVTGPAGLGVKIDTLTKTFSGHQSRPDLAFSNGRFHICYSDSPGTQLKYMEGFFAMNVSVDEVSQSWFSMNCLASVSAINVRIGSASDQNAEWTLMNSNGQLLKKGSLVIRKGDNDFGISHSLSQGIYFLTVRTQGGTLTQKVAIIK